MDSHQIKNLSSVSKVLRGHRTHNEFSSHVTTPLLPLELCVEKPMGRLFLRVRTPFRAAPMDILGARPEHFSAIFYTLFVTCNIFTNGLQINFGMEGCLYSTENNRRLIESILVRIKSDYMASDTYWTS